MFVFNFFLNAFALATIFLSAPPTCEQHSPHHLVGSSQNKAINEVEFLVLKESSPLEGEIFQNISTVLKSMPEEEYYALDFFFRCLLLQEHSSYVIFGDKPVAVCYCYFYTGPNFLRMMFRTSNVQFRKGCYVWKKYKDRFPMKNYLILVGNELEYGIEIEIINKHHFLRIFNQYAETFRKVLGQDMTGEKLLRQIENHGSLDESILRNNDHLLGLLLGYGNTNSWLYQRKEELEESQECSQQESVVYKIPAKPNIPDAPQELLDIETRLQPIKDPAETALLFMRLPGFAADPNDPETQELKKRYLQERKEITKIYRQGKFLETTLRQLCS